jgi:ribosomal protein L11 methyltransferase
LIRLAIRCRLSEAEAALAELLELAPGGVEEVDSPNGQTGIVEYAIYGAPGELPELGALQAAAGDALVEVRSERVPDDWEERWKRFYFPVLIDGRLYVRPPWERPAERAGVVEVVIDPGRAFGTGTHATTGMCLELLTGLRRHKGLSFCDLGCGSGVLAIAAVKLGFGPVLAIDSEQAALDESLRNARLNYVEVETRRVDLRTEHAPLADIVTSNLTTKLLEHLAEGWAETTVRPKTLIASGFLAVEADRVRGAFERAGIETVQELSKGEWAALRGEVP